MDVLDAGRMAVFLDPTGTPFSVWQPGQMPGAGILREPGALTWIELMTRTPETAAEFYPRVFGWTVRESHDPMPYTQFGLDGDDFAGMMRMAGDQWPADLPDHWLVYFQVEDAVATCERAQSLGGTISVPPSDVPGTGRFAIMGDTTGAYFAIIQMAG
jgi:predicted enzyme related to lactoylglutathione lyase